MSDSPTPEHRRLVAPEDDPVLSADAVHWPTIAERRAQLTVADMDDIASGRMWGRGTA
ncbi:hypothetical protein [Streptomyces sp. t39]|uniref:hypothetical protein n=1 Tax=Streptomyces sp. t39 TaxID=1828156 RepID=UPI0016504E21|nr:hypothetical protein [Streptomyces sp. t39]